MFSLFANKVILTIQTIRSVFYILISKLAKSTGQSHIVIGSNYGNRPDDNTLALIKYCTEKSIPVVYVRNKQVQIDHNSSLVKKLNRHSLKATKAVMKASAVYYTHSLSDVIPGSHKLHSLKQFLNLPVCVFVQHGIIGLKKNINEKKSLADYVLSLEPFFDFMCVSTKWEYEIVRNMGVNKDKLVLSGLPRFDLYKSKSVRKKQKILVALTWQNHTSYRSKLETITTCLNRSKLLSKFEVEILVHPMMQELQTEFKTNTNEALYIKISSCALLITDISSIAWDVIFNNGIVFFYQPKETLITTNKLKGSLCSSPLELTNMLAQFENNQFEPLKDIFDLPIDHEYCKSAIAITTR